jgi:hypothetical protein
MPLTETVSSSPQPATDPAITNANVIQTQALRFIAAPPSLPVSNKWGARPGVKARVDERRTIESAPDVDARRRVLRVMGLALRARR